MIFHSTNIFLGIERVTIDTDGSGDLINMPLIRTFVETIREESVSKDDPTQRWPYRLTNVFFHLFSLAIITNEDRSRLIEQRVPQIEEALGYEITTIPTLDEMCQVGRWQKEDLILYGRQTIIDLWCRTFYGGSRNILLDDCIPNRQITDYDHNMVLDLINIRSIQGIANAAQTRVSEEYL